MPRKEPLRLAVATCFGLGLSPIAPGTAGALLGIPIHLAAVLYLPEKFHTVFLLAALLFVAALNHQLTPWAERYWNKKDPGNFVLDEVAGYLATVLLFRGGPNLVSSIALIFLLTRAFDILKLPPARQLERLPGAWGILLDDLASSIYAALALHLLLAYFPELFGY